MVAGFEDILNLSEFSQSRGARAGSNGDLLTEDHAARQFAERHAGELLFCHDTGKWHEWTGAAWVPNRQGKAFQWARELARELCADEDPKTRFIASKVSFAGGVEKFVAQHRPFGETVTFESVSEVLRSLLADGRQLEGVGDGWVAVTPR